MERSSRFGRRARRRAVGAWVVAGLTAGLLAVTGLSGTSGAAVTSPEADSVIRDVGPITITEDRGGQYANGVAATTLDNVLARGCNGGHVNRPKANARIIVTRVSDGTEVLNAFHETSNNLASVTAANATGPFSATWDTTGAEPGLYRIQSIANDRAKVGGNASQTCTPDTDTVLSDFTVELRPWQHANFNDLLGNGRVRMNSNPSEVQWTIHGATSAITPLSASQVGYYAAPTSLPALPADPAACAQDPLSCLPAGAVLCDPAAGCDPRFAIINTTGGPKNHLLGVFDLESGAFAATAATGGKSGILVSAGSDLDPVIADLIASAAAGVEDLTGVDLLALLSTNVDIRTRAGEVANVVSVGVLRGLEISQFLAGDDYVPGIGLDGPFQINAGFGMLTVPPHIYDQAGGDPSQFTVTESALVPNLPTLVSMDIGIGSADILAPVPVPAPLNALTGDLVLVGGGPLVNVYGTYPDADFQQTGGALSPGYVGGAVPNRTVAASSFGPSVDTSPTAPSGLPAWIPGIEDPATVVANGPVDFLGHATLFADVGSLFCLLGACLDGGTYLIGQGLSVYGDSPLPRLADLPLLWDTDNPAAAALNELTSNLALDLLTNPAVGQVLSAALTLLGGGTPDLATVTALLSDFSTFTDLLEAVTGAAGIDAVPGLEDTLNELGVITELLPLPGGGGGGGGNPLLALLGGLLGPLGL